MSDPLPIVFVPGLLASPRLYFEQLPALWRLGPVTVADHTRDDEMAPIARRILADAPPRFALIGLSMGGYIAFEMLRQEPERVLRLALLDTTARADTPEQTENRKRQIAIARAGRFSDIPGLIYPRLVHPSRHSDAQLQQTVRRMAEETGAEAFIRQQTAIMRRADSRPGLGAIRCPTLALVGEQDEITPPDHAREMADAIPGARLAVIAGAGHASTLEAPEAVNEALLAALQS